MNKVAMFVMLVVSFQVSATTIECGSTDIPKLLLDDLYEYSLWAEYAFKRTKPPEVSCIVDGKEITFIGPWDVTYVKTYRVSSITLDENRVNSILEGSDLPAVAYTLKDGNGSTIDDEYYFSCFNKEVVPQLVFKVFSNPRGNIDLGYIISFCVGRWWRRKTGSSDNKENKTSSTHVFRGFLCTTEVCKG